MAIGLVAAPILFALSDAALNFVLRVATEPTSQAMVEAIREQPGVWLAGSIVSILGSLAFIPAAVGLLTALGPHVSRVGWAGIGFLGAFVVGFTGHQAVIFVAFGALARDPEATAGLPFSEATGVASPDAFVLLLMFLVGMTLGCILVGSALWRGRHVPRWSAGAIIAFPILAFITDSFAESYAGVVASLVQGTVLLVGFGAVARHLVETAPSRIEPASP